MSAELAVRQEFSEEQVGLIKRTVAKDATNDELAIFLHQCQRTGLDPLAKQIHFVKRSGKMAIQTAIDGYRLIADRTGKYAGNDDPVFSDEDASGRPNKATVTVWKLTGGVRCPFTATARWAEYFPGDQQGFMWKKMPHVMLGKCAEALALRKAFPQELSGVYTTEEMEQAGPTDSALSPVERNQDRQQEFDNERAARPALPANGKAGGQHEPPAPEAEEQFAKLREAIRDSQTVNELETVGGLIKATGKKLSPLHVDLLRKAYGQQLDTLTEAEEAAAIAADNADIPH